MNMKITKKVRELKMYRPIITYTAETRPDTSKTKQLLKDIVINILVSSFKKSFKIGVFPDIVKTVITLPLLRARDKSNTANYGAVALLPVLSNKIGKLMKLRLSPSISNHNILSSPQLEIQSRKKYY